MTSKERILCAINGTAGDHIPLTTWCFGFLAPEHLRWKTNGSDVKYWYTKRLEHIHTLPQAWTLQDDFNRVLAWRSVGIDDVLDISVPWSIHPEVSFSDSIVPAGDKNGDALYPVLTRKYQTPAGPLLHEIKKTADEPGGWPIQPGHAETFEDYNVARGVRHLVTGPNDIDKAKFLFLPPDDLQKKWFTQRAGEVKKFADTHGVFV